MYNWWLISSGTEIPTIIDPSATKNYPSATGSIIVGILVWRAFAFETIYIESLVILYIYIIIHAYTVFSGATFGLYVSSGTSVCMSVIGC
jgi:hypothetical protein